MTIFEKDSMNPSDGTSLRQIALQENLQRNNSNEGNTTPGSEEGDDPSIRSSAVDLPDEEDKDECYTYI